MYPFVKWKICTRLVMMWGAYPCISPDWPGPVTGKLSDTRTLQLLSGILHIGNTLGSVLPQRPTRSSSYRR